MLLAKIPENKARPQKFQRLRKTFIAIVALPFILIVIFLSFFIPQQQWENFWQQFLED